MKPALSLLRKPASVSPDERGRLLDPDEVSAVCFAGKVGRKWVLANIPRQYRHKVGRLVLFYEGEVRYWMESLREVA